MTKFGQKIVKRLAAFADTLEKGGEPQWARFVPLARKMWRQRPRLDPERSRGCHKEE
jgi:hypothetical protein